MNFAIRVYIYTASFRVQVILLMESQKDHHRPPKYGESMKRKNIHLPEHMIEYAKKKGGGTLAEGVRLCIEEAMDRSDHVKPE